MYVFETQTERRKLIIQITFSNAHKKIILILCYWHPTEVFHTLMGFLGFKFCIKEQMFSIEPCQSFSVQFIIPDITRDETHLDSYKFLSISRVQNFIQFYVMRFKVE